MANEATIGCDFQINKNDATGNIQYKGRITRFQADVGEAIGPTPGSITVLPAGTDIDLSSMTNPGLCRFESQEPSGGSIVEYGIFDGVDFRPFGMVLPGEAFNVRLSYNLGKEYGTGTGTISGETHYLRVRAYTGVSAQVFVGVFGL